jgi:hypothetical protein
LDYVLYFVEGGLVWKFICKIYGLWKLVGWVMKVISKMMGVWRFGVGVWLGSLARELVWEFGLGVDLTPGVSKKFFYLYFYFLEKKSLRLINFGRGVG